MDANESYSYYTREEFEERKKELRKEKALKKLQDIKEFFIRNKEVLITVVPIAVGFATKLVKVVGRRINLGKEERIKNFYCYDRSLGHYWKLKRQLSNREWLAIDKRKANGERLADILDEMNVLK